MRRALQAFPATMPVASSVNIPAPVGGWNTRDALTMMKISDAEIMENWFPEPSYVRSRAGSLTWFQNFSGNVEGMMPYNGTTTVELLIATDNRQIWNATTGGSASASLLELSGVTSGRYQYTNFATPGGNFLIMANGEERPIYYDGSAVSALATLTANTGSVNAFIDVHGFGQRVFYIQKSSLNFYYMQAVEAIGGTAARFPLGSVFNHGGQLMVVDSWTRDGGDGMEDACVFITSEGEVAVYTGTDPSSASTWALEGVYRIPKPLGRRCTTKYGGDLLVLTENGIYPMSVVLSGIEPQSLITDKINDALNDAVRMYRDNYGWELSYYPAGHWLVINVPVNTHAKQEQYVMNTISGAWCKFTGLEGNTWVFWNNKIFFGAANKVIQADTGVNDNGADIALDVKQAPSNFGFPWRKRFTLIRPFINSTATLPVAIALNFDFENRTPTSIPTAAGTDLPYWGTATWSDPFWYWASGAVPVGALQSGGGSGTYAAMRIAGSVNGEELEWHATQITYERGAYV